MTDPITRTQQENAALDAATLAAVVLGASGTTVTDRNGRELRVLADSGVLALGDMPLNFVAPPSTVPTVADGGAAGNLNGTYRYAVTFVSPKGETDFSDISLPLTVVNRKGALSGVPVSPDATVFQRKLYRTTGAPASDYDLRFCGSINNNTDTTFLDNQADADLTSVAPALNRTGGSITLGGEFLVSSGRTSLAIGFRAMDNGPGSYTGPYNLAIGANTLTFNTLGKNNCAIGYSALSNNSTGDSNLGVGFNALFACTTGSVNCAVGVDALTSLTTGHHNTAIHSDAGYHTTTGLYSVGVGYDAYHLNTTGGAHTAIGYQALYSTNGIQNVGIGFQAGVAATTGNNNIFIGANCDTSSAGIANSIGIGANVTLNADNQIKIGNSSHTALVFPSLAISGAASMSLGTLDATTLLKGKGTSTNDNAASGYIGETIPFELASGSAVSLTSGTAKDIGTLTLTAGDWMVFWNPMFHPAATTTISTVLGWINIANANVYPGAPNGGGVVKQTFPSAFTPNDELILGRCSKRVSLSGTTTINLGAIGYFSGSTLGGYGQGIAVRIR